MNAQKLRNVNIISRDLLPTPDEVATEFPLTAKAGQTVEDNRESLEAIIQGTDPRLFVVIGPCSIHDVEAAHEYAQKLKALSEKVSDTLLIIMRVYFEKPRTSVGWKGFINDPYLDDSFHIQDGLRKARELLLWINELGMPVGTEALDPITPQYLDELITWSAIGARTAESQTHREMASGLSTPIGFKNGTDGNVQSAINALKSVSTGHSFLGISRDGRCCVFRTTGNRFAHIVLRGGGNQPNYDAQSVAACEVALEKAGLSKVIMVDCSHGNSMKDYTKQPLVLENCISQVVSGNRSIRGFMIESNLSAGNQPLEKDLSKLRYGVSVTDACIDWETTERVLNDAYKRLKPVVHK